MSIRQIDYVGYGLTQPINQPDCEEEYQRNRRIEVVILDNQLPDYIELLKTDTLVRSYYLEQLDYFRFNRASFQEEYNHVISYFRSVLQDTTLLLILEEHKDARGANDVNSNRTESRIYSYLTQELDSKQIKTNGFFMNNYYHREEDPNSKVLMRFVHKGEYQDYQKKISTLASDKCKGCPF